ncbi:hypothetical protein GYMLUDRAFT_252799 [Collybiopsis luxurians FD-317 M1]|uniref:Uncharacterized protein n=1 Tax=Collybiopsis luxurians FD-317 M1 TaxID=944289 RepID=A0A0D0B8Z4_9AGAR|nr:hypothetical protein GYMLUDRAFT_252799 [Collybiopsis luxurians FD-317 M1]
MSGKDLDSNLVIVQTAALTSKIHGLAGDLQQGVEIIRTWCGVLENDDEKLIQALDKEILPTIEKLMALILSLQKEILLQDMEFQRRQEELCNAQLGGWALMKSSWKTNSDLWNGGHSFGWSGGLHTGSGALALSVCRNCLGTWEEPHKSAADSSIGREEGSLPSV